MSDTITITESSVRELVNEVLSNSDLNSSVSSPFVLSNQINPVVSPSAAFDAPMSDNFVPQNKVEFVTTIQKIVQSFDDIEIPKIYKIIVDALEEYKVDSESRAEREDRKSKEEFKQSALNAVKKKDEKNMRPQRKDTMAEAKVRQSIRKILREAKMDDDDLRALAAAQRDYAKSAEPIDDLDQDDDWKGKTEDEKNLMGLVTAGEMASILKYNAGSTYVKGEQQLLNKFLHGVLDPTSKRIVQDTKRSEFIRFMIREFLGELVAIYSEADPDVEDPDHLKLLMGVKQSSPEYEWQVFESDVFGDWYNESINKALAEGDEEFSELIDELDLENIEVVRRLGQGYGRLDQSKQDYIRLAKLYQHDYAESDKIQGLEDETGTPVKLGGPTGGRKGQAAKALGKEVPAKRRVK